MPMYKINHFTINLPDGSDNKSMPKLLNHLATTLETEYPDINIQDIVMHFEVDDIGENIPGFTVYYSDPDVDKT